MRLIMGGVMAVALGAWIAISGAQLPGPSSSLLRWAQSIQELGRGGPLKVAAGPSPASTALQPSAAQGQSGWRPGYRVTTKEQPVLSLEELQQLERLYVDLIPTLRESTVAILAGRNRGSGVIVSEDGLIITAAHLVERPGRIITVIMSDGTRRRARTLGMNIWADSALAKIQSNGPFPFRELGRSSELEAGQWVLTLGHPGGYQRDRPAIPRSGRLNWLDPQVLRSDCTIIPGDSGGPLFDLEGRVVGIHVSLRTSLSINEHLPVDVFTRTWDRLLAGDRWGDPEQGLPVIGVLGESHPKGCSVTRIMPDSAAFHAGMMPGDLITAVNGAPVEGMRGLRQLVIERGVGQEVQLLIDREGAEMQMSVILEREGTR